MNVGTLVQFAILGKVTSTSGVVRIVGNSWVYRSVDAVIDPADKQAMANQFEATCFQFIQQQLPQDYFSSDAYVELPNTPGDIPLLLPGHPHGTRPFGRLALHQAVYCQLKTSTRGRPYVGFKVFAPVVPGDVIGDELTPAALAAWQTACQGMLQQVTYFKAAGGTNTLIPVVWSRARSGSPPLPANSLGDDLVSVKVYHTLSQWRHRRERVVR